MKFDEQATTMKHEEIVALLVAHQQLAARNDELTRQLEWFKRQLFGSKSERRPVDPDGHQLWLGESAAQGAPVPERSVTVAEHQRRRSAPPEEADDDGLRFDESVPVEEIRLPNPDLEVKDVVAVTEKVTYRLAQRPASYVVLKYIRPVVKRPDGTLSCPPAPPAVLGKSLADVSLLACVAIDKFRYHRVPRRWAQLPRGRGSKPCCMEDEGRPLGIGVQAQVPNRPELRGSRVRVVSVEGKGAA